MSLVIRFMILYVKSSLFLSVFVRWLAGIDCLVTIQRLSRLPLLVGPAIRGARRFFFCVSSSGG